MTIPACCPEEPCRAYLSVRASVRVDSAPRCEYGSKMRQFYEGFGEPHEKSEDTSGDDDEAQLGT